MISHMKNTGDRTGTTVRTGSENAAAQLQYSMQAADWEMSQPLKLVKQSPPKDDIS